MGIFVFSEKAFFYRVREGKDIVMIINNYIDAKIEEVGEACNESHTREDMIIDGMKRSFVTYKIERKD